MAKNLKMLIKDRFSKIEIIIIISFFCLTVLIHSIVSLLHYHECDSSDVYRYLTESSLYSRAHFIGHIGKTSKIIFAPIRIVLGLFSEYLPIQPIRAGILLSLKTTYPLLEGILYGINIPNSLDKFYDYASFINMIVLFIGFVLVYKASIYIGVERIIAFTLSFGMLNLYSINAYSYHLGSTTWYIFGSCLCIYSAVYYQFRRSRITYPLALVSSYPGLIFFSCQIVWLYFLNRYSFNKLNTLNQNYKYLLNNLKLIYQENTISIYTFASILICFFPFNSAARTSFDMKGFLTPFAIFPLGESLDIFTISFASVTYFLFIIGYSYFLSKNSIFSRENKSFKSLNNIIMVTTLNLFVITLLVTGKAFTFSTTRHSLFLLPYILFISSIGLQCLFNESRKINNKIPKAINVTLLTIFAFTFFSSIYSSYLRFDPLKVKEIPGYIREFAATNQTDTITLLDCDTHFLYNNFKQERATYDKEDPSTYVPINQTGKRLIVAQRINENLIKNFKRTLRKGDDLLTNHTDVKVQLIADPYIIENNVYFDSMNFLKNSKTYNQESNPYSRPNNIYILPVNVTKINPT